MAKEKKDAKGYPQRWSQGQLCWSPLAQQQIAAIGAFMETTVASQVEQAVFPHMNFRGTDWDWNVSLILEAVLSRTARDVRQISAEQWQRYSQEYLMHRVEDIRLWHVSQVAGTSLDGVIEHLAQSGFDEKLLYYAGKRNKKLVISMSLSYVVECRLTRG